jgi:hypothetical protein
VACIDSENITVFNEKKKTFLKILKIATALKKAYFLMDYFKGMMPIVSIDTIGHELH